MQRWEKREREAKGDQQETGQRVSETRCLRYPPARGCFAAPWPRWPPGDLAAAVPV